MTQTSATQQGGEQAADKNAIRSFQVNVPGAELTDLRRRINATKWPERETVADQSQGVQLATIQALARYWATEYDWRKVEAKLNALPQYSIQPRGVGQKRRTPSSSTTTGSTKVGTLRPGNSRNSLQRRFAQASDRCVLARRSRM